MDIFLYDVSAVFFGMHVEASGDASLMVWVGYQQGWLHGPLGPRGLCRYYLKPSNANNLSFCECTLSVL
jgi:hypothetical protein